MQEGFQNDPWADWNPDAAPTQTNWWEGPPPPGYTGTWPPALPQGASYGPNMGQIVYGQGGQTINPNAPVPNNPDFTPAAPTTTTTTTPTGGGPAAPGGSSVPPGTLPPGPLSPFPDKFVPPPQIPGPGPAPTFTPPTMGSRPEFFYKAFESPGPFKAPTGEEVFGDPGYQFRSQQGLGQLQNTAAYRGLTRSGGTLNDFAKFNQDLASQEYGQVYNRRAGEYDRNYGNLFNTWKAQGVNEAAAYATNYGVSRDQFDRNYEGATAAFAPRLTEWTTNTNNTVNQNNTNWNHAYDLYRTGWDIFKDNRKWPYDVLTDQQRLGTQTI